MAEIERFKIDQDGNWVWDAIYAPFGATAYINANPAVMDIRFPGQWFQLETGLAYNWHRHYDATTGRYVQPDPLLNDNGQITVRGIATDVTPKGGYDGYAVADAIGRLNMPTAMLDSYIPRTMMSDGPSTYNYTRQNPLARTDSLGLTGLIPISPITICSWAMWVSFTILPHEPERMPPM